MRVVLINTEEATERLFKVKKEMSKTSLDYEVITSLPVQPIDNEIEGWTPGADSLRRTTVQLVKESLEKKEDLWVWEDDCIVTDYKFNKFMSDFHLLKSFDFIHLAHSCYSCKFSTQTIGCFRKTLNGVYNCQSYIISKNIMEEYLKMLERPVPIDQSTKDLHIKYQNSYIVEPSPVSHEIGQFSTIRQKIVNY